MKYLNDKLLTNFFLTFVFVTFTAAGLGSLQLFHVRNFMVLSLESDPLCVRAHVRKIYILGVLQEDWQHVIRT